VHYVLALVACGRPDAARTPATARAKALRVLTLNVQVDGRDQLEQIAEVIRRSEADVVFLQECRADKCGAVLGRMLDRIHVQQAEGTATLSRWPLDATGHVTPPGGPRVRVLDLHFSHAPYQPYQLLGIPYGDAPFIKTEQEAIAAARAARGSEVDQAVAALAGEPIAITAGDFNEPSHLDWTTAAAAARKQPLAVAWPSTKAFTDAGFIDVYRAIHPDPITHPGLTWTPTTRPDDPKDHHDRIDFVFVRGLRPTSVQIVGEDAANADIVVAPYPTDHRGVVATFALPGS